MVVQTRDLQDARPVHIRHQVNAAKSHRIGK